MHTKDKLAAALREIVGLPGSRWSCQLNEMADKAAEGYYHDYLSPLATPELQLVNDLEAIGTPAAKALATRVIKGEFDASKEESEEWAKSEEGQDAMRRLLPELENQPAKIGRLAARHEGEWWNIYWAEPTTMEGAILLGTIRMHFVAENRELKERFLDLMRDAAKQLVESIHGGKLTFPDPPQPAPESERSGHG